MYAALEKKRNGARFPSISSLISCCSGRKTNTGTGSVMLAAQRGAASKRVCCATFYRRYWGYQNALTFAHLCDWQECKICRFIVNFGKKEPEITDSEAVKAARDCQTRKSRAALHSTRRRRHIGLLLCLPAFGEREIVGPT